MVNYLSIDSGNWFSEELHEECGVFGIYGDDSIAPAYACYNGLLALQHRGQESCGISVNDRGVITGHKNMGLVSEVFNKEVLNSLKKPSPFRRHYIYICIPFRSGRKMYPCSAWSDYPSGWCLCCIRGIFGRGIF